MENYFEIQRKNISIFLKQFFSEQGKDSSIINQWGNDVCERLYQFIIQGKMIRGSMVIFSYEFIRQRADEDVVAIASAMEILHSALLIHDDIMDNSDLRR